jgi:hypothetical protein
MGAARSRYEVVVRTWLDRASIASLRVALTPTTVPRGTVYRLRVPADRELSEVVRRLTERHVEILGVRRCLEHERPPVDAPEPDEDDDVVIPLQRRRRRSGATTGFMPSG